MTSDPDDALSWEGDEPERSAKPASTPRPTPKSSMPEPVTEPSDPSPVAAAPVRETATVSTIDEDDEPAAIGNAALVFYGLVGGVYLLFAVGWAVGGMRLRPRAALIVADGMYLPWLWLAVLAPALWFAAAWMLTRGRATWIRILALIAGVVLLVPWPFVMVGTVG